MKIKVAFGNWQEAPESGVTVIAVDPLDQGPLSEHYDKETAEHRTDYGDVREAWLHVPDDVIALAHEVAGQDDHWPKVMADV